MCLRLPLALGALHAAAAYPVPQPTIVPLPNDVGFALGGGVGNKFAQKSSFFNIQGVAPLATCASEFSGRTNLLDVFQCRGFIDDELVRTVDARYLPNQCQPVVSGSLMQLQEQARRDRQRLGLETNEFELRACWLTTRNGADSTDPTDALPYCAIPCGVQADCAGYLKVPNSQSWMTGIDAASSCVPMRFPEISGVQEATTVNVCVRCCCGATSFTGANAGVVDGTCILADAATTLNTGVQTFARPFCCDGYAGACL